MSDVENIFVEITMFFSTVSHNHLDTLKSSFKVQKIDSTVDAHTRFQINEFVDAHV